MIVHQTNCVTRGHAAGIAAAIFERFPHADCYSDRTEPSWPGTIDVRGDATHRVVVNAHAQYYPGKPATAEIDNAERRLRYFRFCLASLVDHISAMSRRVVSVAFPASEDWMWASRGQLERL